MELIAKETNNHVKTCSFLGHGTPGWVPVTTHEIKGFLGLVILMGIQILPDPSQYWSLNHYDNSYTFYRTMSFQRFKQIADNIRMGSFLHSEYCGTTDPADPLHIFRPMMELLGGAMWTTYQPNCCLTIDRALLPSMEEDQTKGRPQTQPQVWLLCDSKSGYCHRLFFQVGEKGGQDLGFSVVPKLVKDLENKQHQVYLTNSLASVPLMRRLLEQGIYASSSFPPPNPILPRELWESGQLEKPGDFLQRQCGPLLATRWRDTKEMGCLTTNATAGEPDVVWRRSQTKPGGLDPINRPMAFRLLQENMRGVDICKQLLACNPLGGIVQDRHWRSFFWFLVNLSIVNAFIVLRESRKENPPTWVQDGLFSQVNFRRRLGNQLAKCAQKYLDSTDVSSPRRAAAEGQQEPTKQRHRMAKISNVPKSCKNCNLKELRRDSVHGCVACKASLCNEPLCFWEFHGLSPLNKGSTKVGFLRDALSGAVDVDEGAEDLDQAMAPVEDLDYSDEENLDELPDADGTETMKEACVSRETHSVSPSPSTAAAKDQEDVLTARQLRIVLFALCSGVQPASRVFSTEPPLIRSWLKEARRRVGQKAADPGSERLAAWVLSMREQQLPISEGALLHKASTLKQKGAFSDSFRISYDWAVSFLLQHQLGLHRAGRTAVLAPPPFLEAKVRAFREFTQRVVRVHGVPETCVAAMDELCLFVDWQLAQDRSRSSEALEFTGSLPAVTVFLTVLADGTVLPSLLLTSRPVPPKVLPESVLLEAGPESLSAEDALDLWTNKVWLPHVFAEPRKSVLVLDRHREHLGDQFLTSTAGSLSLLAVIPGGCSWWLQPVEACLKPALQRLLLCRWTSFVAGNPPPAAGRLAPAAPNTRDPAPGGVADGGAGSSEDTPPHVEEVLCSDGAASTPQRGAPGASPPARGGPGTPPQGSDGGAPGR
uniref:HTH CENPB-type domain-containing protein n=1 Tax=Oryzias sinensis TaxID=183150 RepID=A0A8C8DSC7_9TELE